jgi:secondary thiamine-phosphate synthase enzyme
MAFVDRVSVTTPGRGFTDIGEQIGAVVARSGVKDGLVNVFIRHTSASLIIQENADPDVRVDLDRFLTDLVPDGDPRYQHTDEGPDDMSAHVKSVLTSTSISIPVREGRLALGTWQALYLWEHRHAGNRRNLDVTVI